MTSDLLNAFPVRRLPVALCVAMGVLFLLLRWDPWPKTYFADELIPLAVVRHMVDSGSLDTNWDHADWRGDYAGGTYDLTQYNFSSYHVSLRLLQGLASPLLPAVPEIVFYRACSVLFQLLALALLLHLLWRELGPWPALAGGAFLTVMPQAVIDAHYARPETFVTLCVAAGLWLGWQGCRQGGARLGRVDALAAAVWGVAFACKISLLPMAGLAWLALLARGVRGGLLLGWWLLFGVGFALSAPAAAQDPAGFLHGAGILLNQYGPGQATTPVPAFASAGLLLAYLVGFFGTAAWCVILLAPVAVAPRRLRWLVWGCLFSSLCYILLFAWQKVFFERNLSHLLPLWALLFACGARQLLACCRPHWARAVVALLLVVVLGERLLLSRGLLATFFMGSTVVAQHVQSYEAGLLTQHPGEVVEWRPMQDPGLPARAGLTVVLRVPQYRLPVQQQLDAHMAQTGWQPVGRLALPYGELPYNQLQINHAPVGYGYYIRPRGPAGEGGP